MTRRPVSRGSARRSRVTRVVGLLVGATAVAVAPAAVLSTPASAGPGCSTGFEVTTSADAAAPPAGSLRAAIAAATGGSGAQTICIDTGLAPIVLNHAASTLPYNGTGALTIIGNGNTVQGDGTFPLLDSTTATGALTITGLTMTDGSGSSGAIESNPAVTVTGSTFTNNMGAVGGAVESLNSTVTVTNSTFTGNMAENTGGAVAGSGVTVTNSTFANNTANGAGGGAIISAGTVTVTNSTFTNNNAHTGRGGAIFTSVSGVAVTTTFDDFVDNTATLGATNINLNAAGTLTTYGTVLIGGGASCSGGIGSVTSLGYNFSDDATAAPGTCQLNQSTDLIGVGNNPLLGALANNGGPTQTLLPQTGSRLIDDIPLDPGHCTGEPAPGVTTDQRLLPRPAGPGCDIGAVEVQPATITITAAFTG